MDLSMCNIGSALRTACLLLHFQPLRSALAFPLLHFPPLHFWPYRIFHSRIFSRLVVTIWTRMGWIHTVWCMVSVTSDHQLLFFTTEHSHRSGYRVIPLGDSGLVREQFARGRDRQSSGWDSNPWPVGDRWATDY